VSYDIQVKVQVLALLVEAATYLALAGWCLSRRREGRWAALAGVGAAAVGIVLAIAAIASFQQVFLDSSWLFEKVYLHAAVPTVFAVTRAAGVVLLAAGFVASRRTPSGAPTSSIADPH